METSKPKLDFSKEAEEVKKKLGQKPEEVPAKIDFAEGPLDTSAAEDLEREEAIEQAPARAEAAPEKTEEPHPYGERPYTKEEEAEIYGKPVEKKEELPVVAEKEKAPEEFLKDLAEPRLAYIKGEKKLKEVEQRVKNLEKIRGGTKATQERKAEIEKEYGQFKKDFESVKGNYEQALNEYGKSLYEKKEAELAADPEKEKKLEAYAKTELVGEEILFKESERLNQARQENLPPAQKNWVTDRLYKFSQLPKWERWVISGGIATGVTFLTGGASSAMALGGYFGLRVSRAALGTLSAGLTDQVLGRRIAEGKAKTEKEIKTEMAEKIEAAKGFDEMMKIYSEQSPVLLKKLEAQRAKEHKQHVKKTIATLLVAGGASAGLGFLENYLAAYGYLPSVKGEVTGGRPRGPAVPPPEFQEIQVGKGESPLLLAKQMYIKNAESLGYKQEMGDLKKWAEIASTRHIVGQYLSERPLEYEDLIKQIGEPPQDPIKLDQWLQKVPKGTFDEILHEKVPNLVYEGDVVRVNASGDITAYGPDGEERLGHIEIAKPGVLTEIVPWQAEAPKDLGPFDLEEMSEGRPQIAGMKAMPEIEKPQGEPLPASTEELKQMGFKEGEISELTERANLVGKNFVSGNEYEDYMGKLREKGYFDRVIREGDVTKTVRPTLEAISERIDRTIADEMKMDLDVYERMKDVNLKRFMDAEPTSMNEYFEQRPVRKVIDAYLKMNKAISPDYSRGTLGDFLKKIFKIDIGK